MNIERRFVSLESATGKRNGAGLLDPALDPSERPPAQCYAGDETLQTLPGDHYLTEPADARDTVADHIDRWLRPRL